MTSETTELTNSSGEAKYYLVEDEVTISQRLTVTGDVILVLAGGADLTVNGGIEVPDGAGLTITTQVGGVRAAPWAS